jgi:hypothetical protein
MVLQLPRTRDLNQSNGYGFPAGIPTPTEMDRGQPIRPTSLNLDSESNLIKGGFHERLAQRGIVFSVAEISNDPSEASYNSDSSRADDDAESDWDVEMDKEPTTLPEYQQNVRDVLYEITEVYSFLEYTNYQRMFQKFLHVEFGELELVARVRAEYDSIFDTLMEYLTDELRKIHTEIEKDTSTVLRSWEGARVSGLQVMNIMKGGNTSKGRTTPGFEDVRKKWGVVVS